jgi:hypothetical protein
MLALYRQSEVVRHSGDRGENREQDLRDFLGKHLPNRYGVTKGEIITRAGEHSHAADIIIFDAINCPVLYSHHTAVLPVEGVYGVIGVKSKLSKSELQDSVKKIERFKKLAPRDLSVIQTREYLATFHRPPRPFGAVFAYEVADNSLQSLFSNYTEECERIHDVNYFTNLVAVLGVGLIHFEKIDWWLGERTLLLDTDEFVNLVLTMEKRRRNSEEVSFMYRSVADSAADKTFGRFFIYLLLMLERMRLGTPDLGRYYDPSLPIQITRES